MTAACRAERKCKSLCWIWSRCGAGELSLDSQAAHDWTTTLNNRICVSSMIRGGGWGGEVLWVTQERERERTFPVWCNFINLAVMCWLPLLLSSSWDCGMKLSHDLEIQKKKVTVNGKILFLFYPTLLGKTAEHNGPRCSVPALL